MSDLTGQMSPAPRDPSLGTQALTLQTAPGDPSLGTQAPTPPTAPFQTLTITTVTIVTLLMTLGLKQHTKIPLRLRKNQKRKDQVTV